MKKLLVAALVLVSVFAYAKKDNDTTVTTPTEPKVTELYEYYNGVFKITSTDQFVTIVQADASGHENWQNFNLRGLTLEAAT